MRMMVTPLAILGIVTSLANASASAASFSAQEIESFEKHVRPVLLEQCASCHGPTKQKAGLRVDSRAALLKGGDGGPVLVPGQPGKSRFLDVLTHAGDIKMPPKGKLPAETIAVLTHWVAQGAPWPDDRATSGTADNRGTPNDPRSHWAFRPIQKRGVPSVTDPQWAQSPVDHFILARLEASGRQPAPQADRVTLIRRLTLGLHGVPPTPEEVTAFLSDQAPDAYDKLVDRLLASPRYGERWGRHWLDVARYADTKGYVFTDERRFPFSYTYRDYVIRAFNEDRPYDRFVREQIAADRIVTGDDKSPLAAMGFLTLGRRFLNNVHDIIDDRLDVVMRGLQGLTIGCARCHDHKYDPISIRDYYSLHGVFASSVEPRDLPSLMSADRAAEAAAYEAELKKREQAVKHFEKANETELKNRNRKVRDELRALQRKVDQLKVTHPGAPAQAMVLVDAPTPVQPVVFLRGNPGNRGDAVPRRFLTFLSPDGAQPFTNGSGRLELANAIASRDNPLTARVLVNRVWMHHFGRGLVNTPGDFGLRGEAPSHPELLDWLADTFMERGWSIKDLHRLILHSATYRQAASTEVNKNDPNNRLLAGQNRRRLEYEALRDSLLAVAGRLDPQMGGRPTDLMTTPFATRRTVYGFIDRQNLPGVFRTFDLASPDSSTPQRHTTTVPQQALYMMNSPFLVEQAKHLAARSANPAAPTMIDRINALHYLVFGRSPTGEEIQLAQAFLNDAASGGGLTPWEQYCQVLLLSNEFAFVE